MVEDMRVKCKQNSVLIVKWEEKGSGRINNNDSMTETGRLQIKEIPGSLDLCLWMK